MEVPVLTPVPNLIWGLGAACTTGGGFALNLLASRATVRWTGAD